MQWTVLVLILPLAFALVGLVEPTAEVREQAWCVDIHPPQQSSILQHHSPSSLSPSLSLSSPSPSPIHAPVLHADRICVHRHEGTGRSAWDGPNQKGQITKIRLWCTTHTHTHTHTHTTSTKTARNATSHVSFVAPPSPWLWNSIGVTEKSGDSFECTRMAHMFSLPYNHIFVCSRLLPTRAPDQCLTFRCV